MSVASPIAVGCSCGRTFRVKPEAAGKQVKCPACKSPVMVPEESTHAVDEFQLPVADELPQSPFDFTPAGIAEASRAFPTVQAASPATTQEPLKRRRYRALEIISAVYRALAILVMLFWLGFTATWLLYITTSGEKEPLPALPPGVTVDTSISDPDLSDEAREALIAHKVAAVSPSQSGVAFMSFFPWAAITLGAAFWACLLWAIAELIQLFIDVQSNTFDAAYARSP